MRREIFISTIYGGLNMHNRLVTIKGNKEGLYIHIREGKYELIKEQLINKLNSAKEFFKGGKVVNFKGKVLSEKEISELESIIKNDFGIDVDYKTDETRKVESISVFEGINEGKTKFLRTTLRSGQSIEYDGNLVILGDVNPGANVKANGNIIILGTLRGVAHAGFNGNRKAIITAFKLLSKQIRIADIISRAPDDESVIDMPEIAMIKDDMIIIEPYLTKILNNRRI